MLQDLLRDISFISPRWSPCQWHFQRPSISERKVKNWWILARALDQTKCRVRCSTEIFYLLYSVPTVRKKARRIFGTFIQKVKTKYWHSLFEIISILCFHFLNKCTGRITTQIFCGSKSAWILVPGQKLEVPHRMHLDHKSKGYLKLTLTSSNPLRKRLSKIWLHRSSTDLHCQIDTPVITSL